MAGLIEMAAKSSALFLVLYFGPILFAYLVLVVKEIQWVLAEPRRLWPNGDEQRR